MNLLENIANENNIQLKFMNKLFIMKGIFLMFKRKYNLKAITPPEDVLLYVHVIWFRSVLPGAYIISEAVFL
jgi:hypothetical protein